MVEVPVVEIKDLFSSDDKCKLDMAKRLGEAFTQHGFVYVTNHGLEDLCSKALATVKEFFDLPQSKKDEIHKENSYRGYFRFKEEQSGGKSDWKEGIYYFYENLKIDEDAPEDIFSGTNPWPNKENVAEFQDMISQYFNEVRKLAYEVLDALALCLGEKESFFRERFKDQDFSQLATFHYPPHNYQTDDHQVWGVQEHTDYGMVTVLLQDEIGGLQAKTSSGEWIEVPPIPNTFVINLGDMLKIWTNGAFPSPPHRVKASATKHRYSIALFLEPSLDSLIAPEPFENTLFPMEKCGLKKILFKLPIRYGDYVLNKYRKNIPSVEN